ncbi:MAG: hypothetical protein CVV50_05990 [Spirochaetae bacterium HGW-Spirochaetae-6]|nr:MAG: hypothetical protein CVV50_05990 [Spirochaetae bacterium HGW-Spirochaetae-6]
MKRGFPDFISLKNARDRFYRQKYDNRRNYFKNQISREMSQIQRNRDYIQTKIGNDVAAQRVVTDMAGNVTQIMQVMRKTDDNKIVLYNITSQKNFINVLQYTGTFENAVPNSLDKLKAMTDNRELEKKLYIVQNDKGSVEKIIIREDKNDPNNEIQYMDVNETGEFVTDFPKLKQVEGQNYLQAEFKDGVAVVCTLKVYVLDNDGKVLSDPNVSGGLDFLMSGSVQFVFTGGDIVNAKGIRFNTMPDVGFIVWLRD